MWWVWTTLALVIAAVGVAGTFLPALPGASLIFAAAAVHFALNGADPSVSVSWMTLIGLALLAVFSAVVDFLSGAAGARWFGSGKWGLIGGVVGAIVGLFFGLPGLLIGPLVGALVFELFSGKKVAAATKAGIGSFLGTTAGMVGKLVIALVMFGWLVVALFT